MVDTVTGAGVVEFSNPTTDWRIVRVVSVSIEDGMNAVPCYEVIPAGPCGRNPKRRFIPISATALLAFHATTEETTPRCFIDTLDKREKVLK